MGASWVQIELDKEEIVDAEYVGTQNWPSSTKPELLAIWLALLTVPEKTKVQINTDSEVAINSIRGGSKICSSRSWLRQKNQNLTRSILGLIKTKEIQLSLIKVKGHSGVIWNEVADQLAKKGLEWRLTEAITKEEPQDKDMKFKWSLLWNRIKRQNGIRCTSMRKNRRLGGKVKEATCFCDCASVVAWNIFYEEIWRIRCEDVIKWEKSNGISRRDKIENKKKKNSRDLKKDRLEKELLSEKEKKKLRQEIKEKEHAEKCRREKLLEEAIEKLIAKGEKPFWYGL
ncbi:ribonuclease H-like domain-containing protein [Gigaspora rosea]|uniref:Ribonuclease H-like domain-containing protein n=1 Tax=Gigaspora rosea TaxID=44941 RepID=A0A397UT46_9GLOM|nr:ribonuclease H-like domain-containing protein [Gigaspora rosea]